MVLRWLKINSLPEFIPSFRKQGVNGAELLRGSFQPPKVSSEVRQKFLIAIEQLKRNSLDLFDATEFHSPEEQIIALQSAVIKLSMALVKRG